MTNTLSGDFGQRSERGTKPDFSDSRSEEEREKELKIELRDNSGYLTP